MRNYEQEIANRVAFIRRQLVDAHADGIVFGNSGGKDCALVGILCKMACEDTVGMIMPCGSKQNYQSDKRDGELLCQQFQIHARVLDLSQAKDALVDALGGQTALTQTALANIAPRLRMTALYTVAANENRLVAGTGNRSEGYMGYFTKWGDGGYDFNPIADLTVTEVYAFLRHLNAPDSILTKAPSAGLFDGQTDEADMGVTYSNIDRFILTGEASDHDRAIIERYHNSSEHKRRLPITFPGE